MSPSPRTLTAYTDDTGAPPYAYAYARGKHAITGLAALIKAAQREGRKAVEVWGASHRLRVRIEEAPTAPVGPSRFRWLIEEAQIEGFDVMALITPTDTTITPLTPHATRHLPPAAHEGGHVVALALPAPEPSPASSFAREWPHLPQEAGKD